MFRIRFTLPEVKQRQDTRPASCPSCGGVVFHKHGQMEKAIKDIYISRVTVVRYRCIVCCGTFRHYPEGVDRHKQSRRLRGLAALMWALGLSHRSVSHLLGALGVELCRMSSWRDVQQAGSSVPYEPHNRLDSLHPDHTLVRSHHSHLSTNSAQPTRQRARPCLLHISPTSHPRQFNSQRPQQVAH